MSDDKPRRVRKLEYDIKAKTVSIDGRIYSGNGLPPEAQTVFMLRGLVAFLGGKEDPDAAYHSVAKGETSLDKTPVIKADPWRDSAATVYAETVLKGRSFKAPAGKKLRDTPEFQTLYAEARQRAAGWNRQELENAKRDPDVMREHKRMTGVGSSLATLFAAAPGPSLAPPADPPADPPAEPPADAGEAADAGEVSGEAPCEEPSEARPASAGEHDESPV